MVSIWREGGLDESIGCSSCDVTSHLLFFLSLSLLLLLSLFLNGRARALTICISFSSFSSLFYLFYLFFFFAVALLL